MRLFIRFPTTRKKQSKLCYFLYVTILRNYNNFIMHLFIYLFIFVTVKNML